MQDTQELPSITSLLERLNTTNATELLKSTEITADEMAPFATWLSDRYTRNCVGRNSEMEYMLLCWEPGQTTQIHDHGAQQCWVKVISGEMTEHNYSVTNEKLNCIGSETTRTGEVSYIDDSHGVHKLTNTGSTRAMTLHLYMKRIEACTVFDPATSVSRTHKVSDDSYLGERLK